MGKSDTIKDKVRLRKTIEKHSLLTIDQIGYKCQTFSDYDENNAVD